MRFHIFYCTHIDELVIHKFLFYGIKKRIYPLPKYNT